MNIRIGTAADWNLAVDVANRIRVALMAALPAEGPDALKPGASLIVSAMTIVQAELIAEAPKEERGRIVEHEQGLLMALVKLRTEQDI